jgi:hypothetical protein
MRPLRLLALSSLLVLSLASPGFARVATIEAAMPLQDQSDQSVKAALAEAVQTIARGALAMGLSWVQLNRVLVLHDMLTVQVVATDTDPRDQPEEQQDQQGEEGPQPAPGGDSGRPDLVLVSAPPGK